MTQKIMFAALPARFALRCASLISVSLVLGALAGCASVPENPKDPYEGFNRAMFSVNEGMDKVIKPIAQGYDAAAPLPVKSGIGNFFGNLGDIWIGINNLLQGNGSEGLSDLGRFVINTTIGIGGVFDIASEMDVEKHSADFGQTLGVWGVSEGPFFYWPILGPRTTRDTFGGVLDFYANPVWHVEDVPLRNSLTATRFVDTRASLFPAEKVIEQAAFDKYDYIRDAYLQNRRRAVGGKISAEKE